MQHLSAHGVVVVLVVVLVVVPVPVVVVVVVEEVVEVVVDVVVVGGVLWQLAETYSPVNAPARGGGAPQ